MAYILKHYDQDIMRFDLSEEFDGPSARLIEVNHRYANFIPLGMKPDDAGILRWLKRRTIPSNRAYVRNFLAKQGLSEKNIKGIIDLSKGLSLFCYAMDDDLQNIERFAKTCQPAAYPDHVAFARGVMTKRQRDKLRHVLDFRFQRHTRYNLPEKRVRIIEEFIHNRARVLLE